MLSRTVRLQVALACVVVAVSAARAGAQTLEIHQIAVGNADAGLLVVRDTARVFNLFKRQVARELLDPAQYIALEGALSAKNFDDIADHNRSTGVFKLHMAGAMLSAAQQAVLTAALGTIPGFNFDDPDITQLAAALMHLNANPGADATDPPVNYANANNALPQFDTRLQAFFPNTDAWVNMTQLAATRAKTDPVHFNLTGSVKHATLIDIGRNGTASYDAAAKVNKYMKAYGVDTIDEFILSHYHNDHYGGFSNFVGLNAAGFIKRTYEPGYRYLKPALEADSKRTLFARTYVDKLSDAIGCADPDFSKCAQRKAVKPGDAITLSADITLTAVAANGLVYGEAPGKTSRGNSNPNDFSLAWVLIYKNFRYFTGGDLSGENGGGYQDVETALSSVLKNVPGMKNSGHICAFKVSHHGSRYSSNETFLDTIQARVAVIPNGGKDVHGNPDQQVYHRLVESPDPIPLNLKQIYTLGMMQQDAVYKTREVKKAPVEDIYAPWASIGRDLIADNLVTVAGNTYIVVDDANISLNKTAFTVNWDGETDYEPGLDGSFVHATKAKASDKHECPLH